MNIPMRDKEVRFKDGSVNSVSHGRGDKISENEGGGQISLQCSKCLTQAPWVKFRITLW